MIGVEHLAVSYGPHQALDDITLHVATGEFVLLTGPSGCGKSTLARALAGLIPHALPAQMEGRVEVAGLDTRQHSLPTLAQRVGMVFQNPASQLFHLHVEDEVAFGPRNLGLDEAEVQCRVDWALAATGLLAQRHRKPAELSGGQKQCLAIAAVLAMRPQVLVLDEPTASLDVPNSLRLMATLRALRDEVHLTLILIEHRLAETARLADRLILMDGGRIVADGAPLELLADRSLRARLGLRRPAEEAPLPWKHLIETRREPFETGSSRPLLALDGVSAGYHKQAVVHDVDLAIYPADFLALVGDNGAGKSTLALVAAGLLKPMRGTVHYATGRRPRPGRDVALLFQDPTEQLFTDSVDDEVAFGPLNYGCFSADRHAQTLSTAGLADLRQRRPLALSAGQQQRTALAACLALRPSLVILDEPTLGQDWGHLARLMDFVCDLNRAGAAIVLISHDYKLVHHYARRAILMDQGRVRAVAALPAASRPGSGSHNSGGTHEAKHA